MLVSNTITCTRGNSSVVALVLLPLLEVVVGAVAAAVVVTIKQH
jgi:hypothetical protein